MPSLTAPLRRTVTCTGLLVAAMRLDAQAPIVVEQTSGTTALLQAVSAVSEKIVWVSGHSGAVLRSLDGGATWLIRPVPGAERLQFRDIHALSADVAWIMSAGDGPASTIYRTTDGGATWTRQFLNADSIAFYDCITMFDVKHGIAFSDAPDGKLRILRTEDGEHWNLLPTTGLPPALKGEGGYAASGGCVVSVGERNGWIAAGTPQSRVWRTTDAGMSWEVFPTPLASGPGVGVAAVAFRDANHGIAVGGRSGSRADTTSAAVATTDDGGRTWTLRGRPPPGSLYGVSWVPGGGTLTALAAATGGLMLTRDAGDTWTALSTNQYWSVGAFGSFAWAVGPGGRITRVEFPR